MSKITSEFRSSALRRGMLVAPSKGTSTKAFAFAATIELANLGFVVAPAELETVSNDAITDAIKQARTIMGADRDMTPVYPGFPKQVQELSTMTLLVEQILHYWSAGTLMPNYPAILREGLPIEDMLRNARELRVVSASVAARELTNELVTNPIAMSVDDKALMNSAALLFKPSVEYIVETVKTARNGENVQSFISALVKANTVPRADLALAVISAVKNSDALLRAVLTLFAVPAPLHKGETLDADKTVLSPVEAKRVGNFKLAVDNLSDRNSRAVRMLNIPRPVRRAMVDKLGRIADGYRADNVVGRIMLWRKVMTAVHPYDFNLSEAQKRIVDIIHSNIEYKTLNSLIEDAQEKGDVVTAVDLLATHQPGNLLRRLVSLLRLVKTTKEAKLLSKTVRKACSTATLSSLITAYNGVIAANDEGARVNRVAGMNNTMLDRSNVVKVDEEHLALMVKALKKAIKENLAQKTAPVGPVAVKSTAPVPLVRRDASTADKQMERGQEFAVAGDGDTLRIFSHWTNNQNRDGYMDIGLVILDDKFKELAVLTWNSWADHRELGTYSGDKNVYPGDSAAEYFDLDLKKVKARFPAAIYVTMTIQSWSGFPISKVDIIAGAMLRSKPDSGEVFDARSVNTAFKPTTDSTQSVPFALDLRSSKMLWIDSSNGSTASNVSSTNDGTVGSIVYDELERPRLTLGELAKLWAKAHDAETVDAPVDQKALLNLL